MKSLGMRTVAILVNWKGAPDTVQCLRSLQVDLERPDFKVVVVDNASPVAGINDIVKGISEFMRPDQWVIVDEDEKPHLRWESLPSLILIRGSNNCGFAGGNNIGTRFFLSNSSVEVYWYLNNDTVVESETLESLCENFVGLNKPAAVGSLLVHFDHPDIVQSAGCLFNPLTGGLARLGEGQSRISVQQKKACNYSYLAGASLAVNRSYIDAVGLMAEDYFLYFEELDWAARARMLGLESAKLCLKSVVRHKEGGSIGTKSVQVKRHSLIAEFYLSRSYLKFYWRYYKVLFGVILLRLSVKALVSFVRGDFLRAQAIILGMLQRERRQ